MKYLLVVAAMFMFLLTSAASANADEGKQTFCSPQGQVVFVERGYTALPGDNEIASPADLLQQARYTACRTEAEHAPANMQTGAWCTLTPIGSMTLVMCHGFTSTVPIVSVLVKGSYFSADAEDGKNGATSSLMAYIDYLRSQAIAAAAGADSVAVAQK